MKAKRACVFFWIVSVFFLHAAHASYADDGFWYTDKQMEGIIKDDIAKLYPYISGNMFLDGMPSLIGQAQYRTNAGEDIRFRVYEIEMVAGKGTNPGNYDFVLYYYMGYNGSKKVQHCRAYAASVGDSKGMEELWKHRTIFMQWMNEGKFNEVILNDLAEMGGIARQGNVDLPGPHSMQLANMFGLSFDHTNCTFETLMDVVAHARMMSKDAQIFGVDITARNYLALSGKTIKDADHNDPNIRDLERQAYFALAQGMYRAIQAQDQFAGSVSEKHIASFLNKAGRTYADLNTTEKDVRKLFEAFYISEARQQVQIAKNAKDRWSAGSIDFAKESLMRANATFSDIGVNPAEARSLLAKSAFFNAKNDLSAMQYAAKERSVEYEANRLVSNLADANRRFSDLGITEDEYRRIIIQSNSVHKAAWSAISIDAKRDVLDAQCDLVQNYLQLARGTQTFWDVQPFVDYVRKHKNALGRLTVSDQELRSMEVSGHIAQAQYLLEIIGGGFSVESTDALLAEMDQHLTAAGRTRAQFITKGKKFQESLVKLYFSEAERIIGNLNYTEYAGSPRHDAERISVCLERSRKTLKNLKSTDANLHAVIAKRYFEEAQRSLAEAQREKKYRSVAVNVAVITDCMNRSGRTYADLGESESNVLALAN